MNYTFRKSNKCISVLLILILTLTMVLGSFITADAFAPVVVIGGIAVLAAVLVAYGYYNMSSSDVSAVWNQLSTDVKTALDNAGSKGIWSGFGLASIMLASSVMSSIHDLITGGELPTDIYPAVHRGFIGYNSVDIRPGIEATITNYKSSYTYVCAFTAGTAYRFAWVIGSNTPFKLKYYSPTSDAFSIMGAGQRVQINQSGSTYAVGTPTTYSGQSQLYSDVAVGSMEFYYANTTIDYYNSSDVKTGDKVIFAESSFSYNPAYDSDLSPNISGDVTMNVPVVSAPDTNVGVPETSSTNSISLDTVIAGYGSLQNFFAQGGTITLSDGTVVSGNTGVNDLTRSGTDVLTGTGTGTLEGDVTGIKSLVNRIAWLLTNIWTSVRDITATSDTSSLDLSPLQVNLKDKFPFCIPFDFVNLISVFSASPTDFSFHIQLHTSYWDIDHYVDLSPFVVPILFFRYLAVAFFIYILIGKTRSLIKW